MKIIRTFPKIVIPALPDTWFTSVVGVTPNSLFRILTGVVDESSTGDTVEVSSNGLPEMAVATRRINVT